MILEHLETIFSVLKVFRSEDVELGRIFTEFHMTVAICYFRMTEQNNRCHYQIRTSLSTEFFNQILHVDCCGFITVMY